MNDLSSLYCFQAVYQSLSISKAALKLNLSKASVSKKILALEAELGGELFIRSTRQIVPTSEADRLISKVENLLGAMDEINGLFDDKHELKGKVRVTSGHSMATHFLGELLLDFQLKHPAIEIDFIVTDNVLDPIENDIDISLRVNPPEMSALIGKRVGAYQLHLVASADYLKKNPVKRIEDLAKHHFFAIEAHSVAEIEKSGKKISFYIKKNNLKCTDSAVVGRFIRNHRGIGIRANWDIKRDIESGILKEVLPSHKLKQSGDVWLLSHPSKLKNQRVNSLYQFLNDEIKKFL